MITVRTGSDFRYYLDATTEPSENYYTGATRAGEPAGRWFGRGAAAVGLSGEVTTLQMQALYGLRIDPRDDRFNDPSAWGEAPTIGGPAPPVRDSGRGVRANARGRAGRFG